MAVLQTVLLFVLAGLAEIGGAYLVWQWRNEGKPAWFALVGMLVLFLYSFIQTAQSFSFGRAFAAYGGVFIAMATLWAYAVDGWRPDRFDLTGVAIALVGVVIIVWGAELVLNLIELKQLIHQNPRLSALDLQAKIAAPEIEIMIAMSDEAVEIPLTDLDRVLENLSGWGEVMSLIRNRDAVCELKFPAASLYRHNEWLNSIDPAYNLHIRIANTRRILLLVKANHKRDSQTASLNFANAAGHVFWRVYAQSAEAQAHFQRLFEQQP